MLLGAYALAGVIAGLALALPDGRAARARLAIGALAALALVVLGLRLGHEGGLVTLALVVGGATFLFGLLDHDRAAAGRMRRTGCLVCGLALLLPSTLTLLLPLAALLLLAVPLPRPAGSAAQSR